MSFSYRPALDGVRVVAVGLVLLFHAGVSGLGGGYIGVDIFFVLSGFLVSNVILSEIDETGSLRLGEFLGDFYARRVRRLLPAVVVVIVATTGVFLLVADLVRRLPLVGDAQASLLYVANRRFLATSNDYFAADAAPSPFLHFWSLSIEEQFYVVFPVLLVLLVRFARHRASLLPVALTALMLASVAAQLYWGHADPEHAFYGTDVRLYQLLAGSLLAVILRRTSPGRARMPTTATLAVAGAILLGLLASGLLQLSPTSRGLGATVGATALIAGVSTAPGAWPARLLSLPLPVYVGSISYGIYLWHWPVILVVTQLLSVGPVTTAVLALGLSGVLAALSARVLETPIRRAEPLNRFRWRTVLAGLASSAVVATVLVPPALGSTRHPAVASGMFAGVSRDDSAAGGAAVPAAIDFATVSKQEAPGRSCRADDVEACIVVPGKGPRLLLVGDSQVMMFGPMLADLARQHGFSLAEDAISWVSGLDNLNVHASPATKQQCVDNRGEWYADVLPKLKPDVVLMVQRPREGVTRPVGLMAKSKGSEPQLDLLTKSLDQTLGVVTDGPWQVLLLESVLTPRPFRVAPCLSAARTVGQCPVPPCTTRTCSPPTSTGWSARAARPASAYATRPSCGATGTTSTSTSRCAGASRSGRRWSSPGRWPASAGRGLRAELRTCGYGDGERVPAPGAGPGR